MPIVFIILWNLLLIKSEEHCCSNVKNGKLNCEDHRLRIIPNCHHQQHIITFSLAFNNLAYIGNSSFKLYSNLTVLKLNNNKLKIIEPDAFEFLVNLKILYLNNNCLAHLPPTLLPNLKALDITYLHHNKFLKVPDIANPSVTTILLHSNQIKSAKFPRSYEQCKKLTKIDLRHNSIVNLAKNDFYCLKSLKIQSLMLNNNNMNNLKSKVFHHIKKFIRHLDISKNRKLSDVGFQRVINSFDHVRHKATWHLEIFASRIGLTEITNSTLMALKSISLKKLDLSNNVIALISTDFEMVADLRDLRLNNNFISQISNLQFSGLRNLRDLKLNRNRIQFVHINGFHNLEKLKNLDLSDNKISNLDTLVFSRLGALKKLSLGRNQLMTLATCMTRPVFDRLQVNWSSVNRVIALNGLVTQSLCFTASECVQIIKGGITFPYQLDVHFNFCYVSIPKTNKVNDTTPFMIVSYLKDRDISANESNGVMTSTIVVVVVITLIISFGIFCYYRKPLRLKIMRLLKWEKPKKKSPVKAYVETRNDYLSIPNLEEAGDKSCAF